MNRSGRRQFLKSSARILASATAQRILPLSFLPMTSACSSIGDVISGDNSAMTDRVVIIGGGLAGLAAARELKKSGIPFRLYEGSSRVGGRCQTIEEFNQAGQAAELGAEWVSTRHDFVRSLCKELRLELIQAPEVFQKFSFISGSEIYRSTKLNGLMEQVQLKLSSLREKLNDQQWDSLSAEEMLTDLKNKSSEVHQLWVRRLIQNEWGCEAHEISALAYFDRFQDNYSGWPQLQNRQLKIRGGSQLLSQALYDRVAGVIPGQLVAFQHRLSEVDKQGDDFQLYFSTPDGEQEIRARVVIFALPLSVFKEVKGLDRLDISEAKLKLISAANYGRHGKIVASFNDRFWDKKHHMMTGDIDSQWMWESTVVRQGPLKTNRGILTAQLAGHSGAEINSEKVSLMKSDLNRFGLAVKKEEDVLAKSWALDSFAKGSHCLLAPGQALYAQNVLAAAESKGQLIFCGEHTSNAFMGTMNGAIESGLRAAFEAKKMQGFLTKKLFT